MLFRTCDVASSPENGHRLSSSADLDVFAVSDRLMVMHRGRKMTEKNTSETSTEEVVQYMVGMRDETKVHKP